MNNLIDVIEKDPQSKIPTNSIRYGISLNTSSDSLTSGPVYVLECSKHTEYQISIVDKGLEDE